MKKLIVAIAVGMVCLGAMAQGRVAFANNSQRLVYFDSSKAVVTAGQATSLGLVADLYVGTTAGSLVKGLTQTAWNTALPGQWTSLTAALPAGFAGNTTLFFQVKVSNADFIGLSEIFTAVASTSAISANNISFATAPANSTWAIGTMPVTGAAAGALGSIGLVPVPEPASFALAGLGAAALLIFRRRN